MRAFLTAIFVAFAAACAFAGDVPVISAAPSLDRGYADAYNLDFTGAQREFAGWEKNHPGEALGPVSEAAGLLFSELNRLGVLEAQFFTNDKQFAARPRLSPDPKTADDFHHALALAEQDAQQQLQVNANDADALFALTLVYGLHADYTALVEKRNFASLSYTRQADEYAQKVLASQPSYYDAYLATGVSKYIIGSLAAPLRWMLKFGGYSGDKKEGVHELELTAARGRYLAPFARMLLAIAYLRQDQRGKALALLTELRDDFPGNSLFPREIARLEVR